MKWFLYSKWKNTGCMGLITVAMRDVFHDERVLNDVNPPNVHPAKLHPSPGGWPAEACLKAPAGGRASLGCMLVSTVCFCWLLDGARQSNWSVMRGKYAMHNKEEVRIAPEFDLIAAFGSTPAASTTCGATRRWRFSAKRQGSEAWNWSYN